MDLSVGVVGAVSVAMSVLPAISAFIHSFILCEYGLQGLIQCYQIDARGLETREKVRLSHINLVCTECGTSHEADMHTLGCAECGAPLDVEYEADARHTIRWAGFDMPVPYHSDIPAVSMGEGDTPIVPLPRISESLGSSDLFGKLEFMNPTGSFKDRGTAAMLSVAAEHGVTEVVEDSSGNAGASVSAYSARAGMKAHVFAPSTAPVAKLGQIRVYEARTHAVPGPREASTDAAVGFQRENGLVYASHNLSPYFVEGTKTFAYEVAAQMSPLPDHIVIPVGTAACSWDAGRDSRN